jgi:hypothetical protein
VACSLALNRRTGSGTKVEMRSLGTAHERQTERKKRDKEKELRKKTGKKKGSKLRGRK